MNLEWATQKQNAEHASRTGLIATGEEVGNAQLTEREVLELKKLKGIAAQALVAKQYGVHSSTISGAWRGKTWKYL